MNPVYQRVSDIAHDTIYHFIKSQEIQITQYTFNDYFQYIVDKHKIKTFPHHFENDLILGLTMIDQKGISISYESENIPSRQNFTKCHEIGHLILQHDGTFFAEQAVSKNQQELEADYFASFVLMPDIILLTKILYQKLPYQKIQEQLKVSNKALEVRLTHFLQTYSCLSYPKAQGLVSSFRANTEAKENFIKQIHAFETQIIEKYQSIQLTALEQVSRLIKKQAFISHLDCEAIKEKDILSQIKVQYPNIGSGIYFDFGKAIHYIYQSDKISAEEAKKMAKNLLFSLIL